MRISKKHLVSQFGDAAKAAGWDINSPIWSRVDGQNVARVGAVFLEHNTYSGWKVVKIASEGGGEHVIYHASNAREMLAYLRGVTYAGNRN